ncbi:MAG: hypothetical protein KAR06_01155, partial [Deltaproteobacteria bacterium]|nr:hypothetical protein [Deltaproteobacteria bacterium]
FGDDPLEDYFQNIKIGALFAYSDREDYPKQTVLESVILKKKLSILVMCETSDCKWSIIGIELHQSSNPKHFIHFNLGSYSSKDEADKALIIKKELDHFWNEGYNNT